MSIPNPVMRSTMSRYDSKSIFLAQLLAVIFVFSFASVAVADSGKKPNVVILLADDLGFQDVGCYDGPVKTPTIDSLAAAGTRFSDFYSGCAVCSPSRATLLTGRHHIRTGVYSWISDKVQRSHLRLSEVTLAEVLKDAGYKTAHIGKWHLGLPNNVYDKPTPDQHGFDYWFATENNAIPSHHNPNNFIRNGTPVGELRGYSCQLVVDEAITWLQKQSSDESPFFLNVWFHEPHHPLAAPESIVSQYGTPTRREKGPTYSATIDNTDRAIKRLLNKLDEMNVRDDTLIVYASDNGSYRDDRTGGLRGKKGQNWDGGIRVPGIFVWPGIINSGKVSSIPAGLVDILPTVCGLLGLVPPAGIHLDGSNLTDVLTEKGARFVRHQPLFWHLQKSRPIVAMRDGDFSLVAEPNYELSTSNLFDESWIPLIKSGDYHEFQLFDLSKDPNQTNDIAGDQPEVLSRLKKQLLEINASVMEDGTDWHLKEE